MMTQQLTTLYSYRSQEQVSLEEVIAHCDGIFKDAIALLYAPDTCQFLRLINGAFQDSDGKKANQLTHVFEARIFTEDCELRWVNCDSGKGKAVLLSESEQTVNHFKSPKPIPCEFLKQQYILWGKKAKNQPSQVGWQRLAEARVGKLDIPLTEELTPEQQVCITTREYIAEWVYQEQDKQIGGNYTIIEERLVKLEGYRHGFNFQYSKTI